ncbi:MAG: hypothetical protein LH468_12550 [Nocardioides sp.]|nr:hypothetical protein [Nocardioides sp.]
MNGRLPPLVQGARRGILARLVGNGLAQAWLAMSTIALMPMALEATSTAQRAISLGGLSVGGLSVGGLSVGALVLGVMRSRKRVLARSWASTTCRCCVEAWSPPAWPVADRPWASPSPGPPTT